MRRSDNLPPINGWCGATASIAEIKQAVCERFDVAPIEMVSERRARCVSHPRQVAMYLARELTPFSLPNIGRQFGNRDHTTVMYAITAVEKRINISRFFRENIETLRSQIVSSHADVDNSAFSHFRPESSERIESSMRHLNQISHPGTRKTIIMSKWERGELSPDEAAHLIRKLGLEAA